MKRSTVSSSWTKGSQQVGTAIIWGLQPPSPHHRRGSWALTGRRPQPSCPSYTAGGGGVSWVQTSSQSPALPKDGNQRPRGQGTQCEGSSGPLGPFPQRSGGSRRKDCPSNNLERTAPPMGAVGEGTGQRGGWGPSLHLPELPGTPARGTCRGPSRSGTSPYPTPEQPSWGRSPRGSQEWGVGGSWASGLWEGHGRDTCREAANCISLSRSPGDRGKPTPTATPEGARAATSLCLGGCGLASFLGITGRQTAPGAPGARSPPRHLRRSCSTLPHIPSIHTHQAIINSFLPFKN